MAAKKKMTGYYKLIETVILFAIAIAFISTVVTKILTIRNKHINYNHLVVTETKLKKERESLETEVKNLDDDDYVVKYARDHYIFTEGDEKAVILPEKKQKK